MKYLNILAILLATVAIGLSLQVHRGRTTYSIVRPGIVTIDTFSDPTMTHELGGGSGFIMDADGTIATAAHVVVGGYYRVTYSDGSTAMATILSRDPVRDIALIGVTGPVRRCLALTQHDPEPGTEVLGVVSSYPVDEDGSGYLTTTLSILALPGYSGGPVMDVTTGQVIGVISSGYETERGWAGIVWSVPAGSVSDMFFERRGRRPSCAQS